MEISALCQRGFEKRAAIFYDRVVRGVWNPEVPDDVATPFQSSSFYLVMAMMGNAEAPLEEAWKRLNGLPGYAMIGEKRPVVDALRYENCAAIVMSHIPLPDESALEWEQVLQIRADHRHLSRLRDLRLWVHDIADGDDERFAIDRISQRFDSYNTSLHTHGIRTVMGTITTIISGGAASVITGLIFEAIPFTVAGVSIWAAKHLQTLHEIKNSDEYRGVVIVNSINSDIRNAITNKSDH